MRIRHRNAHSHPCTRSRLSSFFFGTLSLFTTVSVCTQPAPRTSHLRRVSPPRPSTCSPPANLPPPHVPRGRSPRSAAWEPSPAPEISASPGLAPAATPHHAARPFLTLTANPHAAQQPGSIDILPRYPHTCTRNRRACVLFCGELQYSPRRVCNTVLKLSYALAKAFAQWTACQLFRCSLSHPRSTSPDRKSVV